MRLKGLNRPMSHKYGTSIKQDYATSGSCLEALKCTETYGTLSLERMGFLNYSKFLNCKNESVKYNLCSSCLCVIHVDALLYQQQPGEFLCECKPQTVFETKSELKG